MTPCHHWPARGGCTASGALVLHTAEAGDLAGRPFWLAVLATERTVPTKPLVWEVPAATATTTTTIAAHCVPRRIRPEGVLPWYRNYDVIIEDSQNKNSVEPHTKLHVASIPGLETRLLIKNILKYNQLLYWPNPMGIRNREVLAS